MGRHRSHHSPEQGNQGGRHRADRRGDQNADVDNDAEQATSFWRSVANEVRVSRERVAASKRTYEQGLNKLVNAGVYDPRILRRLSYVSAMTMVVEGQDDPVLEHALAYADGHGRYISARTVDDDHTMMHEYAHRTLRMGLPGWNVFREPMAEQVAQDIMQVEAIESDEPPAYVPHARIMHKVLRAGGMTFRDLTRIASGDDQEENYEQFRREVAANTGGSDIVGIAQNAYVFHRQSYIDAHPEEDSGVSAYYAADMAEQELDHYLASHAR